MKYGALAASYPAKLVDQGIREQQRTSPQPTQKICDGAMGVLVEAHGTGAAGIPCAGLGDGQVQAAESSCHAPSGERISNRDVMHEIPSPCSSSWRQRIEARRGLLSASSIFMQTKHVLTKGRNTPIRQSTGLVVAN